MKGCSFMLTFNTFHYRKNKSQDSEFGGRAVLACEKNPELLVENKKIKTIVNMEENNHGIC